MTKNLAMTELTETSHLKRETKCCFRRLSVRQDCAKSLCPSLLTPTKFFSVPRQCIIVAPTCPRPPVTRSEDCARVTYEAVRLPFFIPLTFSQVAASPPGGKSVSPVCRSYRICAALVNLAVTCTHQLGTVP